MLHILGLELPKKIFGHPWLLFADDKMSKSKGNIVYADELADKYGVDAVRYYVLHEIPFASDGNFTIELFEKAINSAKKVLIHDHIDHCLNESISENKISSELAVKEFKEITKYL